MFTFMDMARRIKPGDFARFFPLAMLLLAVGLRLHFIGVQSLWSDEGNSLRLAQRAVPDLIAAAAQDIHPPGYYLALKMWIGVVGESEFALRALSALQSLLAVAFIYGIGKRLYAPGAGLVAALLVAVNASQIYYAQETRMYAQLALFAAASFWAFAGWSARPRLRDSVLLALFNAAGLYTQYAFPVVLLVQGIAVLWLLAIRKLSPRALLGYVLLNLGTLALFAPLLATALRQVTNWPRTGQAVDLGTGVAVVARWLVYGRTSTATGWSDYIWPLLFLVAALLPDWMRRRLPQAWRIAIPFFWLLLTLIPFFALGLFRESNLKFILPVQLALALLMGRAIWLLWEYGTPNFVVLIEALPRLFAGLGLLSILTVSVDGLGNLYNVPFYARDDYRAMARAVSAESRPGDTIILDAPNQREVFTYYYKGNTPIYSLPEGLGGDDAEASETVRGVIAKSKRIYVLYWGESERDPNHVIERELTAATYPASSRFYGDVRFVVYAVPAAPADAPTLRTEASFGGVITLQGAALDRTELPAGDVLGVTLFWSAPQPVAKRYKVFLHLLNGDGKLVAQRDAEPVNFTRPTTSWSAGETVRDAHGLLIPGTLPRGDYTLVVGLYEIDDPAARLGMDSSGGMFELAKITVK